jgi:hypothetical protein
VNSETVGCWFGKTHVNAMYSNTTHVGCLAPPHKSGNVEFALEWKNVIGRFTVEAQREFTFYRVPVVSRARPSQGSSQGGSNVIVHGSDFHNTRYLACKFGKDSIPTIGRWINNSAIECITPHYQPGSTSLQVTNDGMLYTGNLNYEFLPRLALESIYPTMGPIEGGTLVFVRGSSFSDNSYMRCRFGRLSTRAIYINSTFISCLTPRSDVHASTVVVSVSRNNEEYEKDVLKFDYYVQPIMTSIHPREGLTSSTTIVTITGQGFSAAFTRCRLSLGTTSVSLQTKWLSVSKLQCYVTPNLNITCTP